MRYGCGLLLLSCIALPDPTKLPPTTPVLEDVEDAAEALPPPQEEAGDSDEAPGAVSEAGLDGPPDEHADEPPGDAQEPAPCAECPPAPTWQLLDFQPQSARAGEVYGLEGFRGHATLVALLSAW
jgi:hypothetical protein